MSCMLAEKNRRKNSGSTCSEKAQKTGPDAGYAGALHTDVSKMNSCKQKSWIVGGMLHIMTCNVAAFEVHGA